MLSMVSQPSNYRSPVPGTCTRIGNCPEINSAHSMYPPNSVEATKRLAAEGLIRFSGYNVAVLLLKRGISV